MTQSPFYGQMLPHQYFNVEYFFSSAFRFPICNRSFIDLYVASWKCVVAQRHIFFRVGEGGRERKEQGIEDGKEGGSQKMNSSSSVFFVEFCSFFSKNGRVCNGNYE